MANASSSGAGPFVRTLRLILFVALLLLGIQIALNPASARAQVACYPAFIGFRFLAVDVPMLVLPKSHDFHLAMLDKSRWVHDQCVVYANYIPGFD